MIVNSNNTMREIVKHVLKTMSFSMHLNCNVQERKCGHQGCRGKLRLASESHCGYPKHQGYTGWMERRWVFLVRLKQAFLSPPMKASPDAFWG